MGQHHLPLGGGHRTRAGLLALGLHKSQGCLLLLFARIRAWLKGVQQGTGVAQPPPQRRGSPADGPRSQSASRRDRRPPGSLLGLDHQHPRQI